MQQKRPGGMRLDIILGNRKRPPMASEETPGGEEYKPPATPEAIKPEVMNGTGTMTQPHMRLKGVATRLTALATENNLPELQELSDELTSATDALYANKMKGQFASPERNDDFLNSLEEEA